METATRDFGRLEARSLDAGGGIRATWVWTWISLLFLIILGYLAPVWELATGGAPSLRDCVLAALLVLSVIASSLFIWPLREGLGNQVTTGPQRAVILALATFLWVLASIGTPMGLDWVLVPWVAASLIAVDLDNPARWWLLVVVAFVLFALRILLGFVSGASWAQMVDAGNTPFSEVLVWLLIVIPISMVFQVWLWDVVVRLETAKNERAEVARAQERLRFAADLHNIQGHHLQVIALKAELAERIIDRDPVRAAALIHETQVLAREALDDTRELVRGYRVVPFATEVINAASVLDAAGIDCTVALEAPPPEELDYLLGSLLREATTNILRHSAATTVGITLISKSGEPISLTITNNGALDRTGDNRGTGLIGLSEQYANVGGELTAGRNGDGFVVQGMLTAPAEVGRAAEGSIGGGA